MSEQPPKWTAIIPAGGRYQFDEGEEERDLQEIKALVVLDGHTLLDILLSALAQVPSIKRTIVVGPYELEPIAKKYGAVWVNDTGSLLGNAQAGVNWDPVPPEERVVVVSGDLAAPKPESIVDFLDRSLDAKLAIPLIAKRSFFDKYPGSPSTFVRLSDGQFTCGSLLTAPASLIRNPPPAVAALLGNRKSQIAMAKALGFSAIWGLLTGSLSIATLEKRISELTGVVAKAIHDCGPDLALDIDDQGDLDYARTTLETKTSTPR